MASQGHRKMAEFLYDHYCISCHIIKRDVISDGTRLYCPSCNEIMDLKGHAPMMNLTTSDLPGGKWETWQPAFNKHLTSKRQAMAELANLNSMEREKAQEAHVPFNNYEWLGEPTKKDKEFDEMRREAGAEVLDSSLKVKHEEAMKKNLDSKLETVWDQIGDSI
jgi:hypothetical protein